jgi:hypothetical protein
VGEREERRRESERESEEEEIKLWVLRMNAFR